MTLDQMAIRAAVLGLFAWGTLALEVLVARAFHVALSPVLLVVFMAISMIVAGIVSAMWPVSGGSHE